MRIQQRAHDGTFPEKPLWPLPQAPEPPEPQAIPLSQQPAVPTAPLVPKIQHSCSPDPRVSEGHKFLASSQPMLVLASELHLILLLLTYLCVISIFIKATSVPFKFTSMPSVPLLNELSWALPISFPFTVKLKLEPF